MPSPVAHSFFGLAIGLAWLLPSWNSGRGLARALFALRGPLILAVTVANAPDIDYLFGLARGHLNAYHQTATHTLLWALAVSVAVWLATYSRAAPDRYGRWLGMLILLTTTHLALDWLTADTRPPVGIPLFWPWSDTPWHAPWELFPAMSKRTIGDLWNLANLRVAGLEIAWTLPWVLGILAWKRGAGSFRHRELGPQLGDRERM